MKCFVVMALLSLIINVSEQAFRNKERIEKFQKMVKHCLTKEAATEKDLIDTMAHDPMTTRNGKCLQACMGESIGFIKDNKPDLVTLDKMAKTAFEADEDKIKLVNDLGMECADITDNDRCDAAMKIFECFNIASKKKGFNFEEIQ